MTSAFRCPNRRSSDTSDDWSVACARLNPRSIVPASWNPRATSCSPSSASNPSRACSRSSERRPRARRGTFDRAYTGSLNVPTYRRQDSAVRHDEAFVGRTRRSRTVADRTDQRARRLPGVTAPRLRWPRCRALMGSDEVAAAPRGRRAVRVFVHAAGVPRDVFEIAEERPRDRRPKSSRRAVRGVRRARRRSVGRTRPNWRIQNDRPSR